MAERVELPRLPAGEPEQQLQEMYNYLYRMAEALNANLAEIGSADLTDAERQLMLSMSPNNGTDDGSGYAWQEAETLKSLIIKTAQWVKNTLDSYRINLLGEYVAEGKFGKYVRNTRMDVDVTPTGTTQNFKFSEIIEDLKKYEINAKNYIKTGLLRTEQGLPVYGIAVGKDVVTFAEDGTETYNDGNKVAEFTADALSFYQNGTVMATYTGSEVTLYSGGTPMVKIDSNGITFSKGTIKLAELLTSALKLYYNGTLRTQLDGDGMKIYNGSTMLAAFKSGEIDFYQNGNLAAKMTATRIGLYYNGTETLYIDSTGVHATVIKSGIVLTEGANDYVQTDRLWYNNIYLRTGGGGEIEYKTLTNRSTRDEKHNIRPMRDMGETLDELEPVEFVFDDDPDEKNRYGLIYEDTLPILPDICTRDESRKAICYVDLIPMLLKEIQSLRRRVKQLEDERS